MFGGGSTWGQQNNQQAQPQQGGLFGGGNTGGFGQSNNGEFSFVCAREIKGRERSTQMSVICLTAGGDESSDGVEPGSVSQTGEELGLDRRRVCLPLLVCSPDLCAAKGRRITRWSTSRLSSRDLDVAEHAIRRPPIFRSSGLCPDAFVGSAFRSLPSVQSGISADQAQGGDQRRSR